MSNTIHDQYPSDTTDTHDKRGLHLTQRGRRVIAGVGAAGVALVSTALIVEAQRSNPEHPDAQQIMRNEQVLRQGDTLLQGVLTLNRGVHIRTSPAVIEGGVDTSPNLSYTVGDNGEKGLRITGGLEVVNDNKPYLAFELPNTTNKTLKEKATNLRYVSMVVESPTSTQNQIIYDTPYASLKPYTPANHSATSISLPNMSVALPIENVTVDAIEAGDQFAYELSGSDQQGTASNILGAPALSSEFVK